jgi:hypothetical protein
MIDRLLALVPAKMTENNYFSNNNSAEKKRKGDIF